MDTSLSLRYRLGNIGRTAFMAAIAGICLGVLSSLLDNIHPLGPILRGLLIGLIIGINIGFFEEIVYHNTFRRKPYLFLLLIRTVLYSLMLLFWLVIINSVALFVFEDFSFIQAVIYYIFGTPFDRDVVLVTVTAFSIISLLQIKRLHSKGDLTKFMLGVYHSPKEIERIFLFIDLKSSTSIAEKLGNIKYSEFLIDYYYDITDALLMAGAEIYQYVGDEIILSWQFKKGIQDAKCINCFFDIRNTIELLKDKYLNQYGVYPEFKAGLHGGKVVVTWIGDIKKEIVYHGDVLNTTSRLEAECNRYNETLLVSEFILNNLELPAYLEANFIDELQLRGKEKKIKIYSLEIIKKPV
ncbi:adenylate/guanylate cyclase domain-containing protein [Bacteroidota bacterium]